VFYNQLSFLHRVIESEYEAAADEVTPDGEEATTISPAPSVERNKRKKVEKCLPMLNN
jgi:hypothetical protein